MRGNLGEGNLANVVREVYSNRMSGILHLSGGDVTKRIYFKKGSMIFANSDVNDDRLGEFLIRNGTIDRNVFDLASKVMKDTGKRLGRTIVEMDHMTEEEMENWVVRQIEAIIYSLFQWDSGEYAFEQHENPVDEDIILKLSTADIILEGVRGMNDDGAISRALGDPEVALRHSENPLLLYQKISLSPSEGFVLSRVDGSSSLAEIMSTSPLGEEETLRCIYGLVSAGVLDLDAKGTGTTVHEKQGGHTKIPMPEAASKEGEGEAKAEESAPTPETEAIHDEITAKHASIATATLYDLLGVVKTASDVEIKTAYYEMVKKYHPDKHHSPHLNDVRGLLEELFTKISNAYQTLSSHDERHSYDTSLQTGSPRAMSAPGSAPNTTAQMSVLDPASPKNLAERRYVEARNLFDNMNYYDAIQHLHEAIRLNPSRASYHKLLAQALMKNPHWQKDAEEHFLKALEIDQLDVESHLELGDIYNAAGMAGRAQKMYAKALKLEPDSKDATLKLHGKKRPASLKAMLGWRK